MGTSFSSAFKTHAKNAWKIEYIQGDLKEQSYCQGINKIIFKERFFTPSVFFFVFNVPFYLPAYFFNTHISNISKSISETSTNPIIKLLKWLFMIPYILFLLIKQIIMIIVLIPVHIIAICFVKAPYNIFLKRNDEDDKDEITNPA